MKNKYAINKEFFPFSILKPPIRNAKIAGWLGEKMKAPRWIFHDKKISVIKEKIKSFDDNFIDVLIMKPKDNFNILPCLVYYHGGGFFFGAAGYHYKLAKDYVLNTPCILVFVQYRLAPKNPHPIPSRDCYEALKWTYFNAKRLNIDKSKVAVGGDSAGGALAAAVCQMSRDYNTDMPLFQLLIYPVINYKMETVSSKMFTNTPMWNSKLSKKMWDGYIQNDKTNLCYASPSEAETFINLSSAYIETAEFDCLHDEAIEYAKKLKESNVSVEINETKGTMHGFDIVRKAKITKNAIETRINYMKRKFYIFLKDN